MPIQNALSESCDHRATAKWAAVITDRLFPLPRRTLKARDILDQAGVGNELVLVRDHGGPNDIVLNDEEEVNLGDGNVFKLMPRCEAGPQAPPAEPPKRAFICDDVWEVTLIGKQTGHSLKRLFGLPDEVELFRDFESPNDQLIGDDEVILYEDGPIFRANQVILTVKVNNQDVRFKTRRVTALEIKQTAIEQGVKIDLDFVVYPVKSDGSLGAAIPDEKEVTLHRCAAFNCISPDDKS